EGGSVDDPESESAETPGGAVSVAAGLAVTVTDATVKAENTGTITTTGKTSITSKAVADSKAEADGSAVDGSNSVGIGAAVAVNTLNQSNTATARNISSEGGLTVGATQVDGEDNDNGATATSGAGGSNVGVAGSVAVNVVSNKSLATYESGVVKGGAVDIDASNRSATKTKAGASVEGEGDSVGVGAGIAVDVGVNQTMALIAADADITGSDSVAVDANSSHTVELKGEAGQQGDEPASGGAVGVSGAVAVGVYSNNTRAEIAAADTELESAGEVQVGASHTNKINVETGADAAGSKAAIGASIAISVSDADTEAVISRDVSSGSVAIAASSSTANTTKAKASAAGAAPKEEDTSGDPAAADEKSSVNKDVDTWQSFASDKDDSGSTSNTETEDPDASSSEGQVSVAAAVGVTVTDVDTVAKVDNDVMITAADSVAIRSSANTDAEATADGSASNGDIGVGVGVAINVANNDNSAFISQGADVQGGDISVSAIMTEDELADETDTVNTFGADATSGAGASKVGVAGSLGLNIVSNESRAYIAGNENAGIAAKVYTEGELSVAAVNNARHVTKAQSSVTGDSGDDGGDDGGKSVGIGASVAINTITNKSNAEIRDGVTIGGDRDVIATEAGSLTMASSSEYRSETRGEAGAEGEEGADPSNDIAVDAAVALVVADNETKTLIGNVDTSAGFQGDIDLDATSNQSNTTTADGDSAGSSVAIGAVAAVNIGISDTSIAVNSDLKTSDGSITMDAQSTSADKALAKASARGASKKKAQDKYGATEDEVDSGDFGNGADDNKATSSTVLADNSDTMKQPSTGDGGVDDQSGDKGDWSVSVAAAVGANVVDNDTSIVVASGNKLAADKTIDINASSDSNYMSLGSGKAVAVTDNSSDQGGGGIGIGVGVALTVAQNDTVVEVSSIDHAGDVSIAAKSTQNMNEDFVRELTSEAIAGASADKVAVAGAVAVVVTDNNTRAEVTDDAVIGDIGALDISSEDQSKISSRAIAWVDPEKGTTAGVGASAAILVSKNTNKARIGDGVSINSADSISVTATNKRVTPETVGLDFSEIINFDDIMESALLAGRTEASEKDEDNTGTEPEVDPETGGPALIFDKLESKATDAKNALEDYIRSHNYYTEAAAGSASTSGSAKYGVAGSFAVTVLQNETEASIGNVTIDNVAGNVDVTADTDTDIAGFTGSVVKAGSVGVGVSATTLVNIDSTRALVGNDSDDAVGTAKLGTAINIGDLNVSASSDQDILGIGVAAAAASSDSDDGESSGVAVSGVLNTTVLVNEAEARIANDAAIYSDGSVGVDAEGVTNIVSVVGGIALGGKVGVGASVGTAVISGQTHAAIGDNATVVAADSVAVEAAANESIISIVVGAGASKKVGVAGSLATNVVAASTTATIGTDAVVTQTEARDDDGELNSISVKATDNTKLFGLAGGGAIGGKAGVGAAADVAVFSKNTVAETKAGSELTAAGNVAVIAKSKDDIISLTGAGAASSSGAAVAGVASVKVVVDKTHALINSESVVADGNVDLLAQSDTDLNIYDGTIAISGGSAGVGGAVAVNTVVKDTAARIGEDVEITARGDLEDSETYNGDLDRSGYLSVGSIVRPDSKDNDKPDIGINAGELTDANKLTSAQRGVSVTAFTTEDIETIGISASASKSVAVAGNLSIDVIANTTDAAIGAGAVVKAAGDDASDSSASVLVQAYDYTDLNTMVGSGALGVSSAGVGASGDVSAIIKKTSAHIDVGADIAAEQDVTIRAGSEEDIDSIAAAIGVGSSAGVSGAATALVINSETRAYTESSTNTETTKIDAGRDFTVEARDRADLFAFNTALSAGSTAGVGGSAGVVVVTNTTEARVGRGTVSNADRRTLVHADSGENLIGIAMGAAGGGSAGVSGQLGIHVLATNTNAIVEDGVSINKESWNDDGDEDEQSVAVIASNDADLLSISGTISLGGSAGVGGALTADVVLNKVRASVGDSEVYAGSTGSDNVVLGDDLVVENGVSIRAVSEKDIVAVSIAGSGGGSAGVAGAASLLIVGSDYDENDESNDNFGADMDKFTGTGEGGEESSQLTQSDSGSASRSGDTLGAQGDVEVSEGVSVAQYLDDNTQSSGSGHFSLDSAGDTVDVLDSAAGTSGDTVAVVASGAKIKTKGDLEVSANDDTDIVVVGGSIAIGGSAGVAGAGALVLLNQGTRAIVQDDDNDEAVELDAAGNIGINAQADSLIVDVTATVAAGGAAGVSGSLLLNVVESRAEARIGDGALVNQDIVGGNDQSVIVDANNASNVVATTLNGSGSGTAAVGGVALVNVIVSRTSASIGESAEVDAERNIMIIADSSEQLIANGASAAISGVAGVGGVINANTIVSKTEAVIERGAVVNSEGNVLVAAEDDTLLISNAWGVAIGLGGAGVGGSFGVNTIVKDTSATISEGASVYARGNNDASMEVYTGELVDEPAGDNLLDGLISRIEADEPEEAEESDSSSGPSKEQSEGQADKWQGVVDEGGANKGENDLLDADKPSLDNNKKSRVAMKGLAVVASSSEDIVSSNASAAGGLYAGVSGSGQVLSVVTDTDATVEKGVKIETEDLRLSAADHTRSLSLSGGLAISGVAGVGGVIVSGNIVKSTSATLGTDAAAGQGVDVIADGDVSVDADSSEDIDEILVNVAGAGIAGVGGGVASHVVVSETTAEVGNHAVIDSDSDLRVRADSNTEIDTFSGNLSLAGIAAVGGVVSSNVVANTTTARIGDGAKTDADDVTEVSADSVSNLEVITVAASGGAVGVAGDIAVNVITTTAQASIGQDARVNTDGTGNNGQDVLVTASDSSTIDSDTGTIALGTVAVGGALSVDILRNSASATIGSGAEINARDRIDVTAKTVKKVDAKAVSAAAGGVGMSGSIAVAAIGGDLNDDAYEQINGEDDNGDTNSDSGSINKTGSSSSVNPLASDDEDSQLNDFNATSSLADDVDERNAEREADYGVSDDVATSPDPRSGTLAVVGSDAKLKSGGDLNITAQDTTTSNLLAGAIGVGGVAGAGAATVTVVANNTEAMVASNAELDSGAELTISAVNNKNLDATAASGAVSFATSIAGSIGVTVDSSVANAHVDSGAKINQDDATRALGSQQNVTVQAVNNADIDVDTGAISASLGFGIGGTLNVVTTSQTTQAYIDTGSTGRVSAEGLINVDADSIATSKAQSAVGAGGLQAGIAGGVVTLFDDSRTSASIGSAAVIDDAEEVKVDADSTRTATADTRAAAVGAVGLGGSAASVEMDGTTTALVAANAKLGTNELIGNLDVNATAIETGSATAEALAAGLISGAGAYTSTSSTSAVTASTGSHSEIMASGDVSVTAKSTPSLSAESIGVSVAGGVKIGASFSEAKSNQKVAALVGVDNVITANNLLVKATNGLSTSGHSVKAKALGAGGGLLLGLNATSGIAENTIDVDSTIGDGSSLTIGNALTVKAINSSKQIAEVTGLNGGIIAAGFNEAEAKSSSDVDAYIGNNVNIAGGNLIIDADSKDNNFADSVSGSGGVVSGSASEAKTTTMSTTNATIGNGIVGKTIKVDNIDIDARHTSEFNATVDSSNASLVGASGATVTNVSNATVAAGFGSDLDVEASSIDVDSNNITIKQMDGWNVVSGSGGLLDLPAASSRSTIINNTDVNVGTGTTLAQTGSRFNPGTFEFDALNDVTAADKVKMNAGGAIALAKGKSTINATTNNASINVGQAAVLQSLGDLKMGTRADADISTTVAVDVFGLAGEPFGDAVSNFVATNAVNINKDAELLSLRDIRLGAGVDSQSDENDISVSARTDLWNNSLLPLLHDPVANALIQTTNSIDIGTGADVAAVRNIILSTKQGRTSISGVGLGKDIYSETLAAIVNGIGGIFGAEEVSFDRHGGSETNTSLNVVNVDGTARVGIQSKLALEIDIDGNVKRWVNGEITTNPEEGIRILETFTTNVADDIKSRINDLRELISEYTTDSTTSDAAIAVAAYEAEITFLEHKLEELGLAKAGDDAGFNGVRKTQLELAEADLDAYNRQLPPKIDEKTGYETDNADLATANTNLTNTNTGLTSDNTALSNDVTSLTNTRDALDPADYADNAAYEEDYDSYTAQIIAKNGVISDNNTTISNNESTIATNNGTIAGNNGLITVLQSEIDDLDASILTIENGIDDGIYLDSVDALDVNVIVIDDTTAQLGNIYVHADTLGGDGKIVAPGDAEIVITNKSANYLKLNDLIIPANDGGKLYFNNVDVNDNTEINGINAAGYLKTIRAGKPLPVADFDLQTAEVGVLPKIEIISTYDPTLSSNAQRLPNVGPDIIVAAGESSTDLTHISNTRGSVLIQSAAGNIRLEENTLISGATVEVKARNGDFIQSYTDAFSHIVGGEPLTFVPADPNIPNDLSDITKNTLEGTANGIIANGSVLIAARYLNINGTVQSGIPEWGVSIPNNAQVTITGQAGTRTFAQAQAHYNGLSAADKAEDGAGFYTVANANVSDLGAGAWGDWEQVTVEYNAKEDRLELGGVQVKGGYIQIFGQVFNTNGSKVAGNARLRALDGYGEIKVDNLTSKSLYLNTLDAGQGVDGKISITNVVGQNSNGSPILETTVFTRDGGARTGTFFDPDDYLTGGRHLEYSMTNGSTSTRKDLWLVSINSWFNVDALSLNGVQDNGTFFYSLESHEDPLSQGEFLRTSTNTSYGADGVRKATSTETTNKTVSKHGDGWVDCNWWTLCANATHYQYYNIETGEKSVNTYNIDAGNPIAIEFIGFDEGAVDVTSTGGVLVSGGIINRTGDTNITSRDGSILQTTDFATVTGRNISLDAETGIGTLDDAIDIAGQAGGVFRATTNTGDINITKETGDMNIDVVSTNDGRVLLDVDGDINGVGLLADSTGDVIGNRIEFISRNGGIGTGRALKIKSGYTADPGKFADYGLEALARDDISIVNVASTNNALGDLMIVGVESLAGDVYLQSDGTMIDNNQIERSDTRAVAELVALWDDMQLRGASADAKDTREIEIMEDSVTAEYRRYWNARLSQDDPSVYDPNYVVSLSAEQEDVMRDQLALRDNDGNGLNNTPAEIDQSITSYIEDRSEEFHSQHARLYGLSGDNVVQGFVPEDFVEDFRYTAADTEIETRTEGSHWSDFQLALSVSASLLKEITDTVTVIEEPNVKGEHVTLVANGGIGTIKPENFDLTRDDALDFTLEEKAALAAAERGDIEVFDDHLTISQRDDVDIKHGVLGDLSAVAITGDAYLGSEEDIRVQQILAANEIRVKVSGALINANNKSGLAGINFIGQRTILEAAHGGIGTADKAVLIDLAAYAPLTARADDDIWLDAMNDNLAIDTVFTRNLFSLKAANDVVEYNPDAGVDIRAASVSLDVGGAFGVSGLNESLGITLNTDGVLLGRVAEGAFINSPSQSLRIANFEVGSTSVISSNQDINLVSAQRNLKRTVLNLDGEAEELVYLTTEDKGLVSTSGSMTLIANGSVLDEDEGARAIEALELDLITHNGDIGATDNYIDIDVFGPQGVWAQAENGGIYIESPDGDLRLRNLSAGDTSVITSADDILLIQSASGEYRGTGGNLALTAGGSILDESGDSLIEVVDLSLKAKSGSVGTAARSLQVDTGSIARLEAETGVYLTETSGDMNIGNLYNAGGEVILQLQPGAWLNIGGGTVDGRMLWSADNILAENLDHGGNQEELYFEITSASGGMADDVTLRYQSERKVRFGNLEARQATILGDVNNLRFDRILTGEWGLFANDTTSVFVDNTNSGLREEYTIQLISLFEPYWLTFEPDGRRVPTNAYALNYNSDWLVNDFSTENSLARLVEKELSYLTGPLPDELSGDTKPIEGADIIEIDEDAINLIPPAQDEF
ncbi:MAG: hypothetical protein GY875_03690, partial [Gammaproteobacteria bacterium]|nr:hypothetical protein [Gammaproteobacteria bacterium]